jgi:hypothetical protein
MCGSDDTGIWRRFCSSDSCAAGRRGSAGALSEERQKCWLYSCDTDQSSVSTATE